VQPEGYQSPTVFLTAFFAGAKEWDNRPHLRNNEVLLRDGKASEGKIKCCLPIAASLHVPRSVRSLTFGTFGTISGNRRKVQPV